MNCCTICHKEFEQELVTSEFKHGTVKFCPACFESTVNLVSSGLEAYVEQMGKDIVQECISQVNMIGFVNDFEDKSNMIVDQLKKHFRGPNEPCEEKVAI